MLLSMPSIFSFLFAPKPCCQTAMEVCTNIANFSGSPGFSGISQNLHSKIAYISLLYNLRTGKSFTCDEELWQNKSNQ